MRKTYKLKKSLLKKNQFGINFATIIKNCDTLFSVYDYFSLGSHGCGESCLCLLYLPFHGKENQVYQRQPQQQKSGADMQNTEIWNGKVDSETPETQKHKFQTAVSPLKREHLAPSKVMGVKFSQYGDDKGNVSFALRQGTFRSDYEDDVSSVSPFVRLKGWCSKRQLRSPLWTSSLLGATLPLPRMLHSMASDGLIFK